MNRTVVFLAPVSILILFATSLLGIDRLAFRDVSHFYTPLYDYVAERTSEHWVPLWNPLDHTGIPLLGETTTAVLYPPRMLVFALPIETTTALAWYLVAHLILASLTSYLAARWCAVTRTAAVAASIIYPLSGSILFLYCNPPFLCGAAWLPLLLGALIAAPHLTTPRRTIIAGMTVAMMVLAGDPQTAFHGMLLVTLIWVGRRLRGRDNPASLAALLATPLLAVMLAAPQIAASLSWSRLSDRSAETIAESWWQPPVVGTMRHQSFQFSLPPWHLLELATPNAFGTLLPEYRRLSSRVPGDGGMWTPSIYMGFLTLIALGSRLARVRRDGIDAWTVVAVGGLLFAFGHFGFVWILQNLTPWFTNVDSAVGGAYWFLYKWVPGYDAFRYPAKWLTLFAFAASILTAKSIDDWLQTPTDDRATVPNVGLARGELPSVGLFWAGGVVLVGVALAGAAYWIPGMFIDHDLTTPVDPFWGPLQVRGALQEITGSWVHSYLVWSALLGLWLITRIRQWNRERVGCALLILLTVDLTLSAAHWIHRVPNSDEQWVVDTIDAGLSVSGREARSVRSMRTQSGGGWPARWRQATSEHRLLEVEASQRVAWFGRWHLRERAAMFNGMVSIRSQTIAFFWAATREVASSLPSSQSSDFWRAVRQWLGIELVRHSTDKTRDVDIGGGFDGQVVDVVVRRDGAKRTAVYWNWSVSDSFPYREPDAAGRAPDTTDFGQRLREIWQDPHSPPIVSASGIDRVWGKPAGEAQVESIQSGADEAGFVVQLSDSGLFTRPVFQDGHWKAEYRAVDATAWQAIEVHSVDGLFQGVFLPAGTWTVRFEYRPWWLPWSLGLAATTWIALGCCGLRVLWRWFHFPMQNRLNTRSKMSSV